MPRLFITALLLVNVGTASAISGAIESPVRRFQSAVARSHQKRPETFRLQVAVQDQAGLLLATPQVAAPLNTEATGQAVGGGRTFSLTASIEVPRDVSRSYNPPAPCHIVNLRLTETGAGMEKPSTITSMLKLCGAPVAMPISTERTMTVELSPQPARLPTASLATPVR